MIRALLSGMFAISMAISAYGCKIAKHSDSEGSSDALMKVGADILAECEGILTFLSYPSGEGKKKKYKYDEGKKYKYDECLNEITFGTYIDKIKQERLYAGSVDDEARRPSGLLGELKEFMAENGISCKRKNGNFTLTFPKHKDDKGSSYTELEISKCQENEADYRKNYKQIHAWVGFTDDKKKGLSVLVMMEQTTKKLDAEGNVMETDFDWHIFDTNSKGQIIKYEKLVGATYDGVYEGVYNDYHHEAGVIMKR